MNFPRTLDNEKLDKPTLGPIPQSLKQAAGRQDDDLVVFGLKTLIDKVVSLMPFPFHWVSACKWVSIQAGIHINFVMGLNRLLKTNCVFHKNVITSVNTLCHVSSPFKIICTIMVQISKLLLHYTTTEVCCFYTYIYTAHFIWSFDDYDKPVYRNVFIILFMRSLTSIIHHV